ncbi:DEAD/DEAH box helicase [Streptomyces lanatus]|uniref:Helicase associated domain protein n=1 Tax=Streptomyces lanatus TaxID=66900 RepID=A0ABV1Y3K7_9ACTN|nr:DEAD/DEAH box helicase [Streptomyces lanatus]GHH27133.1 helicase [Streptomyces lanatus]
MPDTTRPLPLRPHQKDALKALTDAFAAGEERATVVSACGTGKTHTAAAAADHLACDGTVLVAVPTLELVTQTIERWQRAGRPGPMASVSSITHATPHRRPPAVRIRSPHHLADFCTAPGPRTVFATYASLPQVSQAHQLGLPSWDLIVADEAHRTCTDAHRGWGIVHDDHAIPATRRLYMTATPRIYTAPTPTELARLTNPQPTATMDRREVFGPIVYRLGMAEAIDRGILADYQVVMPVIHDHDLHTVLTDRPDTTPHHDGLRTAALQVALLRSMADHQLRRMLVFHNRTRAARTFSDTLPITAAQAQAPFHQPDLVSRWLSHTHTAAERAQALADFTHAPAPAVLHNVRVLNEGIDIPAIDAVAFAAPRSSVVDALQAIGRALRLLPGRKTKATLVIPLYLPAGAGLTDGDLDHSAYAPLIAILQALRAHDEHFLERLVLPPRASGRRRTAPLEEHYPSPERALEIALVLGLDITLPAVGTFTEGITAAASYRADHGHLDVPTDHKAADGFALGQWITGQRLRRLSGRLTHDQITALDALDMHWTSPRQSFPRMLRLARAYAQRHGHLAAHTTQRHGGHGLGAWLSYQRRKADAGTLHPHHQQQLQDIDPWWNPPWPLTWQRTYAAAQAHVAVGGSTEPPNSFTTPDGVPLGQWFSRQRNHFCQLHSGQVQLLLDLHLVPSVDSLLPHSHRTEHGRQLRRALVACADYLAREGHLRVPRQHIEHDWIGPFPLGTWIHTTRRNPHKLTELDRAALDVLRMVW